MLRFICCGAISALSSRKGRESEAMKLREAREAVDLQQKQFARLVGYRPSSISQVETGARRAWPALRQRCSEVLGVPESELFGDEAV